jgi:aspartate/methionine/tyrosine aminotransferase
MKNLSKVASNIDGQPMFKYLDKAKKLEADGKSMIHMEIGDPDFNTPDNIINAAINSLQNGGTHYCSSFGLPDFRQTIVDATKRSRGFAPDLDQVLVTPGANIGMFYAIYCLVDPGYEVIVPDPGFATYYSTIKMCGAIPVRVPLKEENKFRMNPEDVANAITDKTRLIIINSPHNPTGSVMTPEEIKAIYDLAKEKDIYLYSDEIYSRMNYSTFSSPGIYDHCKEHVIVSNGFSKAFAMTGWRLGTMIGPSVVIERMAALLQTTSSCVSPFIQAAGKEAIDGPQDSVYNMMEEYKSRRDLLVDGLNKIPGFDCLTPGGAFYVFPNITKTGLTSEEVCNALLDAGVVTLPGDCFGEYGKGYLRLCYATSKNDINEALKRINDWATNHASL